MHNASVIAHPGGNEALDTTSQSPTATALRKSRARCYSDVGLPSTRVGCSCRAIGTEMPGSCHWLGSLRAYAETYTLSDAGHRPDTALGKIPIVPQGCQWRFNIAQQGHQKSP